MRICHRGRKRLCFGPASCLCDFHPGSCLRTDDFQKHHVNMFVGHPLRAEPRCA
jgi:hypothetical protein